MKLNKKLFSILPVAALAIALPATFVSCAQNPNKTNSNLDSSKITDLLSQKEVTETQKIVENKIKQASLETQKVVLITTDGNIDDKSFNQQVYESQKTLKDFVDKAYKSQNKEAENQHKLDNYINSAVKDLEQNYKVALDRGYTTWILTGFQQGDEIENFLNDENNLRRFKENKVKIIGVDWAPNANSKIPQGSLISLLFKTEEAGWQAGYASADFLGTKYANNEAKRAISAFGGGDFAGVTDFLNGFFEGIRAWNSEAENANKKVKIVSENLVLDTGFIPNAEKNEVVSNVVETGKSTISLPVAGPFTGVVVDVLRKDTSDEDRFIVGVDTDQSLSFTNDSKRFFTSIVKNIAFPVYQILLALLTKDEESVILKEGNDKFLGSNPKNLVLKRGLSAKFVNITKSRVKESIKTQADTSIQKAIDKWNANPNSKKIEKEMTNGDLEHLKSIIQKANRGEAITS